MDNAPALENLGALIRAAYLRAGFNRNQFVKALDVEYKTAMAWEKGTKKPSAQHLFAIARLLNTSLDELLEITPPKRDVVAASNEKPKTPGYKKAAARAWDQFLVTDAPLVALFTAQELDEIRETRFRSGTPTSPSFYRFVAQAKLEHRGGKDVFEALDAEDITPTLGPDGTVPLNWPPEEK